MMTNDSLLLDTHFWIWLVFDEQQRAGKSSWQAVQSALQQQRVGVSEISFWEVAQKASKKKLDVGDPKEWLRRASKAPGIGLVHVDREVLIESALLDAKERDPADRILIATALRYDLRLVTADPAILDYAQRNARLKVLDARPS